MLVAKKGLSVRETEALVRRLQSPPGSGDGGGAEGGAIHARDPNVQRLEQELADKLGARVAIQVKHPAHPVCELRQGAGIRESRRQAHAVTGLRLQGEARMQQGESGPSR